VSTNNIVPPSTYSRHRRAVTIPINKYSRALARALCRVGFHWFCMVCHGLCIGFAVISYCFALVSIGLYGHLFSQLEGHILSKFWKLTKYCIPSHKRKSASKTLVKLILFGRSALRDILQAFYVSGFSGRAHIYIYIYI
jgi:hypothetical protein